MQVEYTSSPGKLGPASSNSPRSVPDVRVNRPFVVPTRIAVPPAVILGSAAVAVVIPG
jgi:hypothetical protein